MHFAEWESLSEEEREIKCQRLDPYEDDGVFNGVKEAFLREYGSFADIGPVECGLGPFIGPYNCILVKMKGQRPEMKFPKVFLGFPVLVEFAGL